MNSGDTINGFFIGFYIFIGYISAILVLSLFIISLIDLLNFVAAEISQNISISLNPNLLNKDTVENILKKLHKYNTDTSTGTIFIELQVVKAMLYVVWLVVLVIIINVILIIIIIRVDKTGVTMPLDQLIQLIKKPALSVVIMICLCIVIIALFRASFIKNIQPDIIETSRSVKELTELIYDNLTTDEAFLQNIVNDRMSECYKIINKQGNRVEKIGSMIFTMSLFNYYKNSCKDKRVFEEIKKIFTPNQIRLRTVDPFNYVYYNKKTFISNLYQSTEPHVSTVLNTASKKSAVRQDVKNRINDVNRKFVNMFLISSVRSNVRTYMIISCIITFVFLIMVSLVYYSRIDLKSAAETIKNWRNWNIWNTEN